MTRLSTSSMVLVLLGLAAAPRLVAQTSEQSEPPSVRDSRQAPSGDSSPPDVSIRTDGSANVIPIGDAGTQTVELNEFEACTLETSQNIRTVDGFNSEIVTVAASTPRRINIRGNRRGMTRLTIVDDVHRRHSVNVIVRRSVGELEHTLKRLYPEASLELVELRDCILVRGRVGDADHVQQIVDIARQFTPTVLNQMQAAMVEAPRKIPVGMRVITIPVNKVQTLAESLKPGDRVDVLVTFSIRSNAGVPTTKTKTLLEYAEVFATDGGASSDWAWNVSLLVTPEMVNILKLGESKGSLALSWRTARADAGLKLHADVVEELSGKLAAQDATAKTDPAEHGQESTDPAAETRSLRNDIRALHEDVRKLIRLLEERQGRGDESSVKEQSQQSLLDRFGEHLSRGEYAEAAEVARGAPWSDARWAESLRDFAERAARGDDDARLLVFFNASWCGPCRKMQPIVEQLREEGHTVLTIDTDHDRSWARLFAVGSLPTFLAFKGARLPERMTGIITESRLQQFFTTASAAEPATGAEAARRRAIELLGLNLSPLPSNDARLANSSFQGGLEITEVRPKGPTAVAGLRVGDILVGLGPWETRTAENLDFVLEPQRLAKVQPLTFLVVREGQTLSGRIAVAMDGMLVPHNAIPPADPSTN